MCVCAHGCAYCSESEPSVTVTVNTSSELATTLGVKLGGQYILVAMQCSFFFGDTVAII